MLGHGSRVLIRLEAKRPLWCGSGLGWFSREAKGQRGKPVDRFFFFLGGGGLPVK